MTTGRTIGLTAAAFIACGSAAAASTISQTASFSHATTFNSVFFFNQFNPAQGTLTKVTDTLTENLTGTFSATASASGALFSAYLKNEAIKTFVNSSNTSVFSLATITT